MYKLSEPKRTAKYIPPPPQDCTGDVHHGFCGGGAQIVGFDFELESSLPCFWQMTILGNLLEGDSPG